MEFNSTPFIFFIKSIQDFFSRCSSLCSHPLFSTIVTIYTLILLYVPSLFLRLVLSPVFNSTAIILLSLLKLGANEWSEIEPSIQESRILDSSTNEKSEKEFYYLESSVQESRFLDSSTNEKLEKEFNHLEPSVLDHKDRPYEIDEGNLGLNSSFVLESGSLEPQSLDLVHDRDQECNQTNIEFKAKMYLDQECNQTSVESKPRSSLDLESKRIHIEFEHDLGLESNFQHDYHKWEVIETNSMESSQVVKKGETRMEMESKQVDTTMKFLEWNMKAPLEIIYEEYEGEEEDEEEDDEQEKNANNIISKDKHLARIERYPSLSMYYPESETDSSSDGDFLMNEDWETHEQVFFKWEEEEDDREELIEISLDRYGKKSFEFCHVEEDNLIEIDIFPTRT